MAKNRFAAATATRGRLSPGLLITILMLVLFTLLLPRGVDGATRASERERLRQIELTVTNAAVHCYAVEGFYPPSIDYLRENYGLAVDTDKYMVDYRCFAVNIMPQITVLPRDFSLL